MPRLENWSVVGSDNPYLAPELQSPMLKGEVYDHPSHLDGTYVTTSAIVGTDGIGISTYSGSYYTLGEVDTEYELAYPGARERTLKQ